MDALHRREAQLALRDEVTGEPLDEEGYWMEREYTANECVGNFHKTIKNAFSPDSIGRSAAALVPTEPAAAEQASGQLSAPGRGPRRGTVRSVRVGSSQAVHVPRAGW